MQFTLSEDFIKLDALLKATGKASSGGQAKQLIQSGAVSVNGAVEKQRGKKIRRGDIVDVRGSGEHLVVE